MIKKEDIKTMGKAQLMVLLYGLPREEVRSVVNLVIADCRKIPEKDAKKIKMVLRHEVLQVLDFFGFEVK